MLQEMDLVIYLLCKYLGFASLNQLQYLQSFNTTKYVMCKCSNQKWFFPGNIMRQRAGK
jgi:hypothetical protein